MYTQNFREKRYFFDTFMERFMWW